MDKNHILKKLNAYTSDKRAERQLAFISLCASNYKSLLKKREQTLFENKFFAAIKTIFFCFLLYLIFSSISDAHQESIFSWENNKAYVIFFTFSMFLLFLSNFSFFQDKTSHDSDIEREKESFYSTSERFLRDYKIKICEINDEKGILETKNKFDERKKNLIKSFTKDELLYILELNIKDDDIALAIKEISAINKFNLYKDTLVGQRYEMEKKTKEDIKSAIVALNDSIQNGGEINSDVIAEIEKIKELSESLNYKNKIINS